MDDSENSTLERGGMEFVSEQEREAFFAKVDRAARDNPDLPIGFIMESLASLAEPRDTALPFVPRSRGRSTK